MMDYTILYIIALLLVLIGLVWVSKFLRERDIVKAEDMVFAMKALKISIDVVDQLNLQNESKIKNITEIIIESVDFVINNMQDNQDKIQLAVDYAFEICTDLNIELTTERQDIIKQLVTLYMNK